jgi:vancomycin resistance protein YoaR
MKKIVTKERLKTTVKKTHHFLRAPFWFSVGFIIAGITILSIILIVFQNVYKDKAIPGVYIDNINVSSKTQQQIENIYDNKNKQIENSTFTYTYNDSIATVSAKQLNIGYNSSLVAQQAVDLGKSGDIFSNIFIIVSSYLNGITLNSSYTFSQDALAKVLQPLQEKAYVAPVDAQFAVVNNRVTTFKESVDGQQLDIAKAESFTSLQVPKIIHGGKNLSFTYEIPSITLKPAITTESANSFGIAEEIGKGSSTFHHSIPGRIHNVALAASRVSGILVKPGETFSFDKYLGDVSKFTGYEQAYIISNGKTILGDGGGVCQVSTTLFRAILNAGLPITERHAHAYEVGYYTQDAPLGFDATVYVPTVDFKFVNDTSNYILVESYVNVDTQTLSYVIYGKKDGRKVNVTTPVVTDQTPAPPPVYQDDPALPKGTTQQVDFAANGATSTFYRTVTKDGKTIIDEKYVSHYTPWSAVYNVGTKEG